MNLSNFSIGDKVMLTKSFERYSKVGEVYEIGNITDSGLIIRDTHSKLAVGCINFPDFFSCFSKLENKKWTDWGFAHYSMDEEDILIEYRTNGKRVEVKALGSKGVASCMPSDKFSLSKGIYIAFLRCKSSSLRRRLISISKVQKESMIELQNVSSRLNKVFCE